MSSSRVHVASSLTYLTYPTYPDRYFGIAIGFTVASMAYTIGPLSGGALNPAVALLGRVASNAPFALTTTPWIYFAGPIGGGVVAAIIFRCVSADSFNVGSMV